MWESAVDGKRLRFRLVGINNQNFIMGDEETGTWWQQASGRAFLGPLKGRQLRLVPADIVSFATWRADHPSGRVLAPDPEVEKRDGDYLATTWEREMSTMKTVTTLPKKSPFTPRQLVVGVDVDGVSKAWSLDDLRAVRVQLDIVGATPLMIVVGEDGKSVRVFDRRIDGREHEFAAMIDPGARSATGSTAPGPHPTDVAPAAVSDVAPGLLSPSSGMPRRSAIFIDVDTGSEWDFGGRAISGPLQGRALARIPHLLEYWFDWQTYRPKTLVYKPWNPVKVKPDPLIVPKPK